MTTEQQNRRGFGCLGYGCLIAVIIMLLSALGIFFLARSGMRNAVLTFTSENPQVLSPREVSPETKQAAEQKVYQLRQLFSQDQSFGEISLNQSEIDALMGSTSLGQRVSLDVKGSSLSVRFSLALQDLGEWESAKLLIGDLMNRYLVGSATCTPAIVDGVAKIVVTSLVLNAETFGEDSLKDASEWISGFVNSGDAKNPEPDLVNLLDRIKRLSVANGVVHLEVAPR